MSAPFDRPLVAGLAFVLPSFCMVVALGAAYSAYGGIGWMQAVFYGVGAAVIGIIAMSAWKLTTKNIGKDRLLWAIFLVSGAVTAITQSEIIWLFLGAGVLVWVWRVPPTWLSRGRVNGVAAPVAALVAAASVNWHTLGQIGAYFAYAGSFVFGSGLAIVPFLYSGVVREYGWLTDRQFVDAVAVAMITPGPVVITATDLVWMQVYEKSGATLFSGMLQPGQSFPVPPNSTAPPALAVPVLKLRFSGCLQ